MGIFSKLFGGQQERDGSYVRAWATRRMAEIVHDDHLSLENLFVAWVSSVARFGIHEPDPTGDRNTQATEILSEVERHYSGDSSLFEIGCYALFRTDLWVYANYRQHRVTVFNSFVDQFTRVFRQALPDTAVSDLLAERLENYATSAHQGKDVEDARFHLCELIKFTQDNTAPRSWSFENGPLMLADAFVDMGIKLNLHIFEEAWFPTIFQMMENYFEYTEGNNQHPAGGDG